MVQAKRVDFWEGIAIFCAIDSMGFLDHLFTIENHGIKDFCQPCNPLVKSEGNSNLQRRKPAEGRRKNISGAIEESTIAVIVLSENYASSVWCLDVLAKIIGDLTVTIPVLYDVDPEDLRRVTGKFADDFRRHDERETPETVNRWRDSLTRLADISPLCSRNWDDDSTMLDDLILRISSVKSGSLRSLNQSLTRSTVTPTQTMLPGPTYFQQNYSTQSYGSLQSYTSSWRRVQVAQAILPLPIPLLPMVTQQSRLAMEMRATFPQMNMTEDDASVTNNISTELTFPASQDFNLLLGMDRHKKAVYGLLDLDSKTQVRSIGIWGMEGVGKTTLAECVLEDISRHFQHHCFLTDVNNIHQNRISPSLLEQLTKTRTSNISFDAIKPSLVNRTILLVVDGVNDNEQLKDIIKISRWLGPGSRVIMTSKDKSSLVSCGVEYYYEMGCLRYDEAFQLFSQFAFKQDFPVTGFERFSVCAVHFAGHLPLALKVLGSFLYGKNEESWKCTLRRLEASQDNGTLEVTSYIGACEYLPRHQIELERYVGADVGEYSSSYHMLL